MNVKRFSSKTVGYLIIAVLILLIIPYQSNSSQFKKMVTYKEVDTEIEKEPNTPQPTKAHPKFWTAQPLLIVAYQRTGSSYFNNILNSHPDVVSWYEPLDGLFWSLYGTEQGYTVPVDIYAYSNGTFRDPPDYETESIIDNLQSIFSCNYQNITPEVIFHKFNYWTTDRRDDMYAFTTCLKRNAITINTLDRCRKLGIDKICPRRFGEDMSSSNKCQELLHGDHNSTFIKNYSTNLEIAKKYTKCRDNIYSKAEKCINVFKETCKNRKVQATKTVRGRMYHAKKLLETIPNLKVIHLYRKPAPVMPSRRGLSVLSLYGAKDLTKEAKMYCKFLVDDILLGRELEHIYPNQIKTFVFQDYVTDMKSVMKEALEFVGLEWHKRVSDMIDSVNRKRLNKKRKTFRFKKMPEKIKKIFPDQSKEINQVCLELFEVVDFIWPNEQFPDT